MTQPLDRQGILKSVNWPHLIVLGMVHVGAIMAFWQFDWVSVGMCVVLYWVAGSLGIGIGYHRLLTHRSFKTSKFMEYFFCICGTLAVEGGPISWVATHRMHHFLSDQEGDPHSPRRGFWWSHVGWILSGTNRVRQKAMYTRFAPDLLRDPFYSWLNRFHILPSLLLGVVLLGLGGWSMLLWGLFLRVTLGLHATWLVNSATHLWGSQSFSTRDDSRNNWWVALLTFGEGWHNNHHAHPTSSRHGLTWYQIDMNWWGICILHFLGLARSLKDASEVDR